MLNIYIAQVKIKSVAKNPGRGIKMVNESRMMGGRLVQPRSVRTWLAAALSFCALVGVDMKQATAQQADATSVAGRQADATSVAGRQAVLTTVAYRVHHMSEMVSFYREAFGVDFREVDARGIRSQFGEMGPLTVKFVPIRADVDFENFPIHQLGFDVTDVQAVLDAAERYGGRVQNEPERQGDRLHAAIRDPDGNTIEIYGPLDE